MKLRKDEWKYVKFGDYVTHIEKTETQIENRKNARYISVEHIETDRFKIKTWFDEEMPTFFRVFKKGQILFGKRRAYQRKVAIAEFDGICSPHIWALEAYNGLLQELLPFIMLSDKFYNYVNANSAGTMSPYLKWPQLSNYRFPLPPLSEQKLIAGLFQSIEAATEQAKGLERNLKALRKSLIDGFVSDHPVFGSLLNGQILKTVQYGNVTQKLMRKIDPVTSGIEKIVAGENIDSEDLRIRSWGTVGKDFLGPAFHVLFKPGDILYGSRRTYLRKVAQADFEGVCANTTYVIKADENQLLQGLLKYIMLSERFTQYSIGVSKGSTNPYINWKDLHNFEFQIPDLSTQLEIVSVLDSTGELIEHLKSQIQTLKNLKQKLLNEILG